MGLLVQSDMATPVISDIGTKEQIDEFLKPALARRQDRRARRVASRAPAATSPGIQTVAQEGRRRLRHQRRRRRSSPTARAPTSSRCSSRPNPEAGAHGCSFFLVPTNTKGFNVAEEAEEDRQHVERHRGALLRGHARPEALPARRREHGLHVPDAELPDRAPHRVRQRVAGAFQVAIEHAIELRRASAWRSASRSSSARCGSTSSSTSTRSSRRRKALHLQVRRRVQRRALREEGAALASRR